MIYPWQQQQWQRVMQQHQQQRLAHALLLTGDAGLGKNDFAKALAQAVLCDAQQAAPCGHCHNCHLFTIGNHPDYLTLSPQENSKLIKVDQVRQLCDVLSHTAHHQHYQVAVVTPAELMNRAAANALLKTLEEPSGNVLILLVSHQPALLPATILSRCQILRFTLQDRAQAVTWLQAQNIAQGESDLLLKLADGAPLRARDLASQDIVKMRNQLLALLGSAWLERVEVVREAQSLLKLNPHLLLQMLIYLILDILRIQLQANNYIVNHDCIEKLNYLAKKVTAYSLTGYLAHIQQNLQLLNSSTNVNVQLLIEDIFVQWLLMREKTC